MSLQSVGARSRTCSSPVTLLVELQVSDVPQTFHRDRKNTEIGRKQSAFLMEGVCSGKER